MDGRKGKIKRKNDHTVIKKKRKKKKDPAQCLVYTKCLVITTTTKEAVGGGGKRKAEESIHSESLVRNSGLTTFRSTVVMHAPFLRLADLPPPCPSYSDPQTGFQNLQNTIIASSDHFDAKWLFGDHDVVSQGSRSVSSEGLHVLMRYFVPVLALVSQLPGT